jgi:probable HAF family extracellular repeat protein
MSIQSRLSYLRIRKRHSRRIRTLLTSEMLESRLLPASIVDLGTLPGGTYSEGDGINDEGQVVGYATGSNGNSYQLYDHAFIDTDGVMTDLGTLPGGTSSFGTGVNNAGQVVGFADSPTGTYAFIDTDGVMTDLGTLPGGSYSEGKGINDEGQVVGDANIQLSHAFIDTSGVMTDLGSLPGSTFSSSAGINNAGQVVGNAFFSSGNYHSFIDTDGVMTDLGTLPGCSFSIGTGINNAGQVVGYAETLTGIDHPFIDTDGVMTDLNSLLPANSGWLLQKATAINNEGQITGLGIHDMQIHAFIINLGPSVRDINVTSTTLGGSSVDFTYQTTGDPGPFGVDLFFSPTATFDPNTAVPVIDPVTNLPAAQTVTPAAPNSPPTQGEFSFASPPFDSSHLPYILVVADPTDQVQESNKTNNVAAVALPDLAVTPLSFSIADGGLDHGYTISGASLPVATNIDLDWASGTTLDTVIGNPITRTATETAEGTYPLHAIPEQLATPPGGAKYLLVVADQGGSDHPGGLLVETDKSNNLSKIKRPPIVVNIVTHGFRPPTESEQSFIAPFNQLGAVLNTLPPVGSALDGLVSTYVHQWDSTDGWEQAILDVTSSLFLPPPLAQLDLLKAKNEMQYAALLATEAAWTIDAQITNPANGYLLSPDYGQVIDLIGHSRGAAVNALLSQILTQQGYTVDQFTSLDGYSTDWPFPSSILGDISIVGDATALTKVNYQVQNGLGTVLGNWLEPLVGTLPAAELAVLGLEASSWKAPNRIGFQNIVIPGTAKTGPSNHLNIVQLFSSAPYIFNSYEGEVVKGIEPTLELAPRLSDTAGAINRSESAFADISDGSNLMSSQNYSNFIDGSFNTAGMLWNSFKTANIPTVGNPLLQYWAGTVTDPAQLLASSWDVTGDARLARAGASTVAELDQSTPDTSIGQYLELDSQVSAIAFNLSVLSAKSGDKLLVLLNNNVLGSIDLTTAAGRQTVPLTGYASQRGEIAFQLVGASGDDAKIQLGDLNINESNRPLIIDSIVDQLGLAGNTLTVPVTANDSNPGRILRYALGPVVPAGIVINASSGVVTWSVPASQPPGNYPVTIAVSDNGTPSLSQKTSFNVVVQRATTISDVSGSGNPGGTGTLSAKLTSLGMPLAGQTVAFGLTINGASKDLGTATTNADGVATLTGVSLSGFGAGTSSGAITAAFAGDAVDLDSYAAGNLIIK